MAKLAFRGLVFASFCMVAACGGDDGGSGIVFTDGGAGGDGGGAATCNPVSQQGCAAGEKCASVTVQTGPTIVQTLCVPDGTAAAGGECTTGEPGPTTGFDNCVGGNECVFGECRPVCRQQGSTIAGTCAEGGVCQIFNDLFEDLETDDVGICIPQCDPVAGLSHDGSDPVFDYTADCGAEAGLQCYMNLFDGIGVCSGSFEGAPSNGEECPDRNGDGEPDCALNGCAPAHGPLLPGGTLAQWQTEFVFFANTIFGLADVCIQFCDVGLEAWGPAPSGGATACPPTYECRYVTGLYLNFDNPTFAPDNFGLCVPQQQLGSCANHELGGLGAYLIPEGSTENPAGVGENNFVPGCNNGQVILDKANFCSGTEGAVDVDPAVFGNGAGDGDCVAPATAVTGSSDKKVKWTLPKHKMLPADQLPDFSPFFSSQL